MSTIKRFEDLECWQEARKLVNMVGAETQNCAYIALDRKYISEDKFEEIQ